MRISDNKNQIMKEIFVLLQRQSFYMGKLSIREEIINSNPEEVVFNYETGGYECLFRPDIKESMIAAYNIGHYYDVAYDAFFYNKFRMQEVIFKNQNIFDDLSIESFYDYDENVLETIYCKIALNEGITLNDVRHILETYNAMGMLAQATEIADVKEMDYIVIGDIISEKLDEIDYFEEYSPELIEAICEYNEIDYLDFDAQLTSLDLSRKYADEVSKGINEGKVKKVVQCMVKN